MATKPTFWLNEVIGRQPNTDDNALTKPSQAIEPDVSFVVASLPSPALSLALNPQAAATMMIGAIFATNIARICCNPNGIALATGTLPSNL